MGGMVPVCASALLLFVKWTWSVICQALGIKHEITLNANTLEPFSAEQTNSCLGQYWQQSHSIPASLPLSVSETYLDFFFRFRDDGPGDVSDSLSLSFNILEMSRVMISNVSLWTNMSLATGVAGSKSLGGQCLLSCEKARPKNTHCK